MSAPGTDCLFCRIVSEEIPAEIVAATEFSVAFRDISPAAPTHILVIPRRHVPNAGELAAASAEELADVVLLAREVARSEGLDDGGEDDVRPGGYRLVVNTGARSGQSVFHAHVHVLGGRDLGWPPG
ncbi:MAG: HIT domain-containing protein [Tetrasphaera sp.]|nr:HIT domain-containing protein [Tetrasphaera sp.]